MRKALLLLLLTGCATHQEPTEGQIAVLSYYVEVCKKQGFDEENIPAMKGCILSNYNRDVQAGVWGYQNSLADVIGGMGDVYLTAGSRRPVQCDTFNYPGVTSTTCR